MYVWVATKVCTCSNYKLICGIQYFFLFLILLLCHCRHERRSKAGQDRGRRAGRAGRRVGCRSNEGGRRRRVAGVDRGLRWVGGGRIREGDLDKRATAAD